MKNCTPMQLLEIDRCFQYTLVKIRADGVEPRSVLFGSTVDNWFREMNGERNMKIVVAGNPPNSCYARAFLGDIGPKIDTEDEKHCGDCVSFFVPERLRKELQGWGICEVTGRVTHESTPCDDCEDYTESEGKED